VSVVIPTHQRRDLTLRALASVAAQSLRPREVLVVADGCSDGTEAAVSLAYPSATVVSQDQLGVSGARNAGIRRAAGEWIALLDSDDEWKPEKLERQLAVLRSHPECGICHCDEIWIRRGNQVLQGKHHRKRGGSIFTDCLALCAISPSAALVHRSVFERVGGFDEELPACEDYDFWLRACADGEVAFVDEPLVVKYGGHDDQLSRRYPAMDRFRMQSLGKFLRSGAGDTAQRAAARETLRTKFDIYVNGARKRGRHAEARRTCDTYGPLLAGDPAQVDRAERCVFQ
jgi:GT2 family glycosyltransferase